MTAWLPGHFELPWLEEQLYLMRPWPVFRIRHLRRLFWARAATHSPCRFQALAIQHSVLQWMLDGAYIKQRIRHPL
jgi:hypothetical protein